MKPSDFKTFPSNSIFHNYKSEEVARNVMIILSRTGDTFRFLDRDEYKAERQADGHFTESERGYYDKVIAYCHSQETAALFSPVWAGAE